MLLYAYNKTGHAEKPNLKLLELIRELPEQFLWGPMSDIIPSYS